MSELAHVIGPITRSLDTLVIAWIACPVCAFAIIAGVSSFVVSLGAASTVFDLAMAVP
jgi:hypothetical protein